MRVNLWRQWFRNLNLAFSRKFGIVRRGRRRRLQALRPDAARVLARQPDKAFAPTFERLEDRLLLASGVLDTDFGDNGKVTTDLPGSTNDYGEAVELLADGSFLVAGRSQEAGRTWGTVGRYFADGTLDTAFGDDGYIRLATPGGVSFEIYDIAVDGDGRIVLAGTSGSNFAAARLLSDGSWDTAFGGGDGWVTVDFAGNTDVAYSVVLTAGGEIILAGRAYESGAGGDNFAAARLTAAGVLDTTFGGGDGKVTVDFAGSTDQTNSVALTAGGEIVLAGYAYESGAGDYNFAAARFTAAGVLDTTFGGGDGKVTVDFAGNTDVARSVALTAGGEIVLAGYAYKSSAGGDNFAAARLTAAGMLDTTFGGGDGKVTVDFAGSSDQANSVALTAGGEIVLAGSAYESSSYNFAAARLTAAGVLDTTFGGGDGRVTVDFAGSTDQARSVALTTGGEIILAGYSNESSAGGNNFAVAQLIGVNLSPVSQDNVFTTDENTAATGITGALLDNDTDPDGDNLTVTGIETSNGITAILANGTVISLTYGTLTINTNGTFSYTFNKATYNLAEGEGPLEETFQYTINDGYGGTDTAEATITITGQNDDPVGVNDDFTAVEVLEEAGATAVGNVLTNDTDPDNGETATLTVDPVTNVAGIGGGLFTITAAGAVTFNPNGEFNNLAAGETATTSYTYTLLDAQGAEATATVTVQITGQNDDPVGVNDDFTAVEVLEEAGATAVGNVLTNDSDPDNGETATLTVDPVTNVAGIGGGLFTITAAGVVTFNPNGEFNNLAAGETATATYTYTLIDAQGAEATATVTVQITGQNDDPVGVNDDFTAVEVLEEAGATTVGNVLTNDTDPDNGETATLTVAPVTNVAGTGGGLFMITAAGAVTFNPNGEFDALAAGETATASYTYTLIDAQGAEATATITVQITGQNDDPVGVNDDFTAVEVLEEAGATAVGNVLTNDTDPDNGETATLTVDPVTNVAGTGGGLFTITAAGAVTFNPNGEFNGLAAGETATASYTYTLLDAQGADATATVTVEITGQNDAPVGVNDDFTAVEVLEEAGATAVGNVLTNDSDPDNGETATLTVDPVTNVAGIGGGLFTITANGDVTFNPNGEFNGLAAGETATASYTYTLLDAQGVEATATVTVQVTGQNDAPTANADPLTGVNEDDGATAVGNVLTNDTDPDTNDTLAVTPQTNAAGTNGGLFSVIATGDVTFDPNGDFEDLAAGGTRTTSFTYTINDGQGGTDTATATVTVTGQNDAPTAGDDTLTTDEQSAAGGDLLADDTDPDTSDTLTVTEVNGSAANVDTEITLASGALLTVNADGTYTYDPNGAFDGLADGATATDSFEYTIDDGHGGTDTATVTITITGLNDAPVAANDTAATDELKTTTGNLLANDSDPNGDPLTVTHINGQAVTNGQTVTLASGAKLTVQANGSYTYDPNGAFNPLNENQTAADTFTYTISDGHGGTATASATITVTGLDTRGDVTINPKAISSGKSNVKLNFTGGEPVDLQIVFTDSGIQLIGQNGTTINGLAMLTLDGADSLRGKFGDGDDKITIVGDATKARIDLGAGNNTAVFDGFTSDKQTSVSAKGGSLDFTAIDSTFGKLLVTGGNLDDMLTFLNVRVDNGTTLRLLDGMDNITIHDSTFDGHFSVSSSGDGAAFNVETGAANGAMTQFLGKFKYATGANPAILLAPDSDDDAIAFGKKASFLARQPAGTLTAGSQVNFAQEPNLKNVSNL